MSNKAIPYQWYTKQSTKNNVSDIETKLQKKQET